jgi:hypothetical protein
MTKFKQLTFETKTYLDSLNNEWDIKPVNNASAGRRTDKVVSHGCNLTW